MANRSEFLFGYDPIHIPVTCPAQTLTRLVFMLFEDVCRDLKSAMNTKWLLTKKTRLHVHVESHTIQLGRVHIGTENCSVIRTSPSSEMQQLAFNPR